jgi:cyclic pyranopterin monophosphate synthase
MKKLSHIDRRGRAKMVDVSAKSVTHREAYASCKIKLSPKTVELVRENRIAKGEVLNTARIAGISAAKRTFELIPLTHPIPLENIDVEMQLSKTGVKVFCRVKADARTGAEMEALVGAAMACLTIYDMTKAVERGSVISDLRLEYKSGGKSGTWKRMR